MTLFISRIFLTGIVLAMAYFAMERIWTKKVDLLYFLKKPSENIPIMKEANILISPASIPLHYATKKEIAVKITNNEDFPLYDVHWSMTIKEGDLQAKNIVAVPVNKEKYAGGIPKFFYFNYKTKKGMEIKGFIFNNINAHSTEEFLVKLDGNETKKDSLVIFKVYYWYREPSQFIVTTKKNGLPEKFEDLFKDQNEERRNNESTPKKPGNIFFQRFKTPDFGKE